MKWWPIAAVAATLFCARVLHAQDYYNAEWIWYDSGQPATEAPAGKVWFRFELRAEEPSTGGARVICDDHFVLWVNGRRIGEGEGNKLYRFNLNNIVDRGPNVIAVEATNTGGRAGLFVDGEVRGQGGHSLAFDTGDRWRATLEPPTGDDWLKPGFDVSAWKKPAVIGPHATSPWNSLVLKESYLDRYALAPGFEIVRIAEPDLVGTLVAMTWGNRGRLIASRENGPMISLIDDNADGTYDRVVEYTNEVTNCQGLCMVFDDLYAMGKGPDGVGLYRLPDANHDDVADGVKKITNFKGNMGDHGPHDVVYGPDGWLYLNLGNHSWFEGTPEPTTAVRDYYEGYLLEPRFEDGNGHAAGIKAPGGTIWRFTPEGTKWWCETSGFRNEYDFAFNARGDMFTFDSDMEWDVGLPWYRPIRVNHCIPGAEFGWRSGATKWPPSYFDSLPGTVDVGRGSPTGVVFYDHIQLPESYRGAFLMCDWSMGRLMAAHLRPSGATYTGEFETIVNGNPLNVSDVEVDRDGSIVFVTGGRKTEGGVYRVTYTGGNSAPASAATVQELLSLPQLQSGWAREIAAQVKASAGESWESELVDVARNGSPEEQIRALTLLAQLGPKPSKELLIDLASGDQPTVQQFAIWLLGDHAGDDVAAILQAALKDGEPVVKRRACEAFVRTGIEAPVDPVLDALASDDRWLRFAARLTLERIPEEKWVQEALASANNDVVSEALLALFRRKSPAFADARPIEIARDMLAGNRGELSRRQKLQALRLVELALIAGQRPAAIGDVAQQLLAEFPTGDNEVDFESSRILAAIQSAEATEKLLAAAESAASHGDATHYVLCLSYLNVGWNFDFKRRLMDWYESTRDWEGGHSMQPYLANIVAKAVERFEPAEREKLLAQWAQRPFAAALLLRNTGPDQAANLEQVIHEIADASRRADDPAPYDPLLSAAIEALGKDGSDKSQAILRGLFESFPDRRDQLVRTLAEHPSPENWPLLIRGLQFGDPSTLQLCIRGLRRTEDKPKEPGDLRAIILAALKLGPERGRGAIELLQELSGTKPNESADFPAQVAHFQSWYQSTFPDAPPAEAPQDDPEQSKYTFAQLVDLVENGHSGDVERGRKVFADAKCVKCHRFLNEGESIGPDLTSLRRRFQRKEIIESILYPSQVISDQYRMVTVVTLDGLVHNGMPVQTNGGDNAEKLVLLLSDASRIEIPKDEIDQVVPSKVSVMPAGILKDLTPEQIADLFAFLETSKFNEETKSQTADAGSPPSAERAGE